MNGYELTPSLGPPLASAAFLIALGGLLWRRRAVRGAIPLSIQAVVIALLCVVIAAETAAIDFDARRIWFLARDALVLPGGVLILWFALEYASCERYLSRPVVVLLASSVLGRALLYVPDAGRFLWARLWWDGEMRGELAPLGIAFTVYTFGVFVLATAVLLVLFIRSPAHRLPVGVILAGQAAVRLVYPVATLKVAELPNFANVLVFDFAALMYAAALLRFRLFDLVPVARQTIIERMPDAMFVLDARHVIADANHAARRLVGPAGADVIGVPFEDRLHARPSVLLPDAPGSEGATTSESTVETVVATAKGSRTFQVTSTNLLDWQGATIGSLVLLHDITDLREAGRGLLEQQRALASARERELLARDLHDSVGQVLGYIALEVGAIRKLVLDEKRAVADQRLGRLAGIASEAQSDIRRTIAALAQSAGEGVEFVASLRARLDALHRDYGISTSVATTGPVEGTVPAEVGAHLLRIVDEAIMNAIRHGRAHDTRVALERDDAGLRLVVEDDGVGFDPAAVAAGEGGRYGLRFMRQRAIELGGDFDVTSERGHGTRVSLSLPLDPPTQLAIAP